MADISNLQSVNIIRYLQTKKSDGTFGSPSYLGSEARFITPTRNTNLNSLEEQLLLGCDTITEQWVEDNGDIKISTQYHDGDASSYYLLESTIYKNPTKAESGISIGTDESGTTVLNLSSDSDAEISNEAKGETAETLDYNVLYISNSETYSLTNEGLAISPPEFTILKTDILSYIKNAETKDEVIIKIAEKITSQRVTANGKIVTQEKITKSF